MGVHDGQIGLARKMVKFREFPVKDSKDHGENRVQYSSNVQIAFITVFLSYGCRPSVGLPVELPAHPDDPDVGQRFGIISTPTTGAIPLNNTTGR